ILATEFILQPTWLAGPVCRESVDAGSAKVRGAAWGKTRAARRAVPIRTHAGSDEVAMRHVRRYRVDAHVDLLRIVRVAGRTVADQRGRAGLSVDLDLPIPQDRIRAIGVDRARVRGDVDREA